MIPYAVSIKYMIAGYAVIFIILAVYLISLVLRWKHLQRDKEMLDNMKK